MCQQDQIDRITSRHIAKLLTRLGDTLAPIQSSEIKRQMRFLADDLKQVIKKGVCENGGQENNGNL
jgi:hypothetical protein